MKRPAMIKVVKDRSGKRVRVVNLDAWVAGLYPVNEQPIEQPIDVGASVCPRCHQYCFALWNVDELVCGYCRDVAKAGTDDE